VIARATAALVAAVLLAAPASALAAGCPKTTMPDVENEVMCLQCGVPLNLAEDAPSAQRERALIQTLIDRCESKAQIKSALVAQFGDRVLAQPKSSAAWLVPAIAFAVGAVLVAIGALRWRSHRRRERASEAVPVPAGAAASPDAARLDADLERYDL
jgi:cytochrome c-type biogenesis protein CcmH/NrfF